MSRKIQEVSNSTNYHNFVSTFILEKCFISVHFIVDYHQVDLIQKHWFHFSVPLLPQKIL